MPKFGRSDQAVTANSTTTNESTIGAPIGVSAYVKNDKINRKNAANAHFGNTSPGSRAQVDSALFNNTTPGAFILNKAVGVFGLDPGESAIAENTGGAAHSGWNLRTIFTGPLVSIYTTANGTLYNNTDIVTIASPQASSNATASLTTNTSGGIVAVTITNPGSGFTKTNISANVSVANSTGGATTGSGAVWVATAGGRAGRQQYETLVAFGSLGAQTAAYGTPAVVANSSTQGTL